MQSFRTTKIQGIKTEVAASSPPPPPPPPPSPLQSLQSSECVCSWAGGRIWTLKRHSWTFMEHSLTINDVMMRGTLLPSRHHSCGVSSRSSVRSIGRPNYVRVSDPAFFHNIDECILTLLYLSAQRASASQAFFQSNLFRAIAAFSAPFQSNPEKVMRNAAIALNCYKQCFRMALEMPQLPCQWRG